jgi:hypothetical protein
MAKPMIDTDALISMFESATARQGEQLKKSVGEATLAALQGRELTLANIKSALKAVAEAASAGAARNAMPGVDAESLLDKAVAGMDQALLKAVEANRTALATLTNQGADLREKHMKKALADLEKIEDTMFAAMKKASESAGGTLSGAQATAASEQITNMADQMKSTLRDTRAASLRAAQAMAESYTAMVSGVLLGMSEALQSGAAAKPTPAAKGRK